MRMKYTDLVLKHPIYREFVEEIHMAESFRIYCGHEIDHAMDVARLAWIYYLEDWMKGNAEKKPDDDFANEGIAYIWNPNMEETKDLFYVAALLHDIGRVAQYETGVHHAVAGIEPAKQILMDIQAPIDWVGQILDVIAEHSDKEASHVEKNLQYYIAKADHDCRLCFSCLAADSCKWTEEQRNQTIHS